jgi:hypothetical protein
MNIGLDPGNRRPTWRIMSLNLGRLCKDLASRAIRKEAAMTHWHDTMVDRPETDEAAYVTGWTISGLAVLGTIVAVWLLGI